MSVSGEIIRAYRGFKPSMQRQIDAAPGEERLLIYLMLAIFLFFIARTPDLLAMSAAQASAEVSSLAFFTANLVAWFFFAPIMFYLLAGISRLVARMFGGKGNGRHARLALFWAQLVIAPLALVSAIVQMAVPVDWLSLALPIALGLFFAYVWGSFLSVAEGFKAPYFTIAAIILTPFTLIVMIRLLTMN